MREIFIDTLEGSKVSCCLRRSCRECLNRSWVGSC